MQIASTQTAVIVAHVKLATWEMEQRVQVEHIVSTMTLLTGLASQLMELQLI